MAFDRARDHACRARSGSASTTSCRRSTSSSAPTGRSGPPSSCSTPRWVVSTSTTRSRPTTPSSTRRSARSASARSSTTSPSATPRSQVAASLDALKDAGFHWATRSGVTVSIDDVTTPGRQGRDPRRATRRRPRRSRRTYERGVMTDDERRQELIELWTQAARRGRSRPWRPTSTASNPIYMMVDSGASGNMNADPAGRGHAWSGGQPEGRDHPAPDQGQLPRGPLGPRVLHLHPRCPQGSRRHRAPHRRLGLPDPSSGGRVAGRHHP